MMTDDELAARVRDSVQELYMRTRVEDIIVRARHRRAAISAAAVACCAVIAIVALGVNASRGHGHSPQLAAYTLSTGTSGSTTLTLHKGSQYRLDPDALRRALAEHGIRALVTVGKSCDTEVKPDGLDNVVSAYRESDGNVFLTINPAAIPVGAELSIGYFPTHTTYSLINQNAPTRCS